MQFVAKIAKRNLPQKILPKLARKQAKVYWHPEAELLLFENYTRIRYSRKFAKNKCVCFNEIV